MSGRDTCGDDGGFTLVEVIVAMTIFAVVSIAALPLLVVGLKAGARAEVQTLAKDLSQLRIERLRNLPYQVDRQNGPFVDLLDRYYTDASGAATASIDEAACTGQYVASAAGPVGAPTGPAYRVTCTALPEADGFSQIVYAQFLKTTTSPVTPPTTYDSQTTGKDSAPSGLLGITVLTNWTRQGSTGSLRTYTEIADARSNEALITTQAQAVALRVSSNLVDPVSGRSLVAKAGEVKADGSLTTGSVASVQALGASLQHTDADNAVVEQRTSSVAGVSAPTVANPAGSSIETSGAVIGAGTNPVDPTWRGCGWGWFGKSAYGNVSATTTAGRPVVPSNNAVDVTLGGSTTAQSGLVNAGNGCNGFGAGFRNWLTAPTYSLGLSIAKPLVFMTDPTGGGGTLASGQALGEASVTATDLTAVPNTASARAKARTSEVRMLPTTSFPDGLVVARLTSSSITCKAGSAVAGAYSLVVSYPGGSTTVTYSSTSATVPTLPAASGITFVDGGIVRRLSDYLEWTVSPGITEADNGAQSIDQVFGLTSPASVVGPGGLAVQLGSLSCAASDDR